MHGAAGLMPWPRFASSPPPWSNPGTTTCRASARRSPTTPCSRSRPFCWSRRRSPGWSSVLKRFVASWSRRSTGWWGARVAWPCRALVEGASRRDSGLIATVIGGITFVLGATGAFLELQAALDTIWRVKPKPGIGPRRLPDRSAALVRAGRRDWVPAAGLARGQRRSCGVQRLAGPAGARRFRRSRS